MPLLPAPRLIDPAAVPALRWGVIGTGIADQFVHAIHAHTVQRAVAVTARDAEKTRAFADAHGIGSVHASVDALVNDPEVDVVYVATPHPLHREQALAAIAAGKHVLIEKPIALNAADAREILDAGRAAGVLVAEAMWTRYLPQADVIRQVLDAGLLGEIDLVRADFGSLVDVDPTSRMFDPALGGGAMLDLGVYIVAFASSIIGPPTTIRAVGTLADTGVDDSATIALKTDAGAQAALTTTFGAVTPIEASVFGSRGRLDVLSPFYGPVGLRLSVDGADVEEWRDDAMPQVHDGLSYQATAFASYVGEGLSESPVHPHDEVVSVLATIDEVRRQITAG
ncbi:Gfo/Idh/MocA family protein [Microbacterium oleivorans]|uniref:Oxidoreductase, NAD-binding domain protein n=1 Tax=Microbacterium oleivorans TaxID=273677 RepID=A0A031FR68_9MICO|nr:Gfo/Idh/MocA family oxidoreductase [Microbacterium oleivorans]EZP26792.1 Oxidoreductase, NAD-binding domain protein [Microbacterium oleivorans]